MQNNQNITQFLKYIEEYSVLVHVNTSLVSRIAIDKWRFAQARSDKVAKMARNVSVRRITIDVVFVLRLEESNCNTKYVSTQ